MGCCMPSLSLGTSCSHHSLPGLRSRAVPPGVGCWRGSFPFAAGFCRAFSNARCEPAGLLLRAARARVSAALPVSFRGAVQPGSKAVLGCV